MSWNEFSNKRILAVKQRIQTIVVYEELEMVQGAEDTAEVGVEKEAIVDSFDRPMQAQYS